MAVHEYPDHRNKIQTFALILGIVFLAVGVLGFFPPLLTAPSNADVAVQGFHGKLFGLFEVNWVHNVVHLAVGAWGLAAARTFGGSRSFARGLAIIYAILAVMGLIPGLNSLFGFAPLHGNDVWLHAATAAVSAYFGWGAPAHRRAGVTA